MALDQFFHTQVHIVLRTRFCCAKHWPSSSKYRHRRQEHFLVAHKTYTKPSTFVKYVIKLVGTANPIADSKFVEEYVMNNKAN